MRELTKLKTKFLEKFQPYRSQEPLSLTHLLACKIISGTNCAFHWLWSMKYSKLHKAGMERLRRNRAKNAFVFANGPSIGDLDFTKIKSLVESHEFDLLTVNSFASKGISTYGIVPKLMAFNDPFHYIAPSGGDLTEQARQDIAACNRHGIPTLVPHRYYSYSQFKHSIPFCGTYYTFGKNMHNLSMPLGHCGLTAFTALSAAVSLGYERIYVCGFDNSYFKQFEVDRENRKMFVDRHFFDAKKREFPTSWCKSSSLAFMNFARCFRQLEKFRHYCPKGVTIYNIALETYTDAFERNFELDVYKTPQDGQ